MYVATKRFCSQKFLCGLKDPLWQRLLHDLSGDLADGPALLPGLGSIKRIAHGSM